MRFACEMLRMRPGRDVIDDDDDDDLRIIAIQSLSNAELIKLLQFEIGDDGMMEMVEAELERRKTEGTKQ
jgi:hypothetical protein